MIKSAITAKFDNNIKDIWNIVTNNKDFLWRSDIKKIEIIDSNNFIEYTKNGFATKFTITKKEYLKQYEFDMINKNLTGHWVGTFKELDNGLVEINFTEQIKVSNIIMSLLAKFYLKKQQERYISDLIKKLNY